MTGLHVVKLLELPDVKIDLAFSILCKYMYTVFTVCIHALGQWSVDKCRIWILEESIKYHYPELVANAKRNEEVMLFV